MYTMYSLVEERLACLSWYRGRVNIMSFCYLFSMIIMRRGRKIDFFFLQFILIEWVGLYVYKYYVYNFGFACIFLTPFTNKF